MSNINKWIAGAVDSYSDAFNSADLASLASGSGVLSSISDIDNTSNLDLYAEVSFALAISSATPAAGDYAALYLAELNQDGSSYGDGTFTSGSQKAWAPAWQPCGSFPFQSGAGALTSLVGTFPLILLPRAKFRFLLYVKFGAITGLSSGTQTVKYRTANLQNNG
jgi:hypothetical protein